MVKLKAICMIALVLILGLGACGKNSNILIPKPDPPPEEKATLTLYSVVDCFARVVDDQSDSTISLIRLRPGERHRIDADKGRFFWVLATAFNPRFTARPELIVMSGHATLQPVWNEFVSPDTVVVHDTSTIYIPVPGDTLYVKRLLSGNIDLRRDQVYSDELHALFPGRETAFRWTTIGGDSGVVYEAIMKVNGRVIGQKTFSLLAGEVTVHSLEGEGVSAGEVVEIFIINNSAGPGQRKFRIHGLYGGNSSRILEMILPDIPNSGHVSIGPRIDRVD